MSYHSLLDIHSFLFLPLPSEVHREHLRILYHSLQPPSYPSTSPSTIPSLQPPSKMPCSDPKDMCKECAKLTNILKRAGEVPRHWWWPHEGTAPLILTTRTAAAEPLDVEELLIRDFTYVSLRKHIWEKRALGISFFVFMGREREGDKGGTTTPVSILVDIPLSQGVGITRQKVRGVLEDLKDTVFGGEWEWAFLPDHANRERLGWLCRWFDRARFPCATFRRFAGVMPELHRD
ncbi:uncharacterized protein DSM5745_11215 [Aspergillus mulundensis]|uniref:Uncharacterized protein n=1 Tax=Aspergillus mulundensis TaxID=1810919 RepID=A0A3D8QAM1_9EURO|nr:hypothetical protein DSM5745_11215 [Aspergillus mulundensis]RDW58524.1 hypothetical protein DSM5745_11215 [Aspergillus mulundensis]